MAPSRGEPRLTGAKKRRSSSAAPAGRKPAPAKGASRRRTPLGVRADWKLTFRPATAETWSDLESLFGARGACGGCWCMWWRLTRSEFVAGKGEGNRKALRRLLSRGASPGVLAYADGAPAGWCAVAPRLEYPRLARSRILGPIDDAPVWSVTCFFVAKPYRRSGLSVRLLGAAIDHVRARGGRILEGYPVELREGSLPDPFVYTGLASAFEKAGFVEAARRSKTRPIMRYTIAG